MISNKEKTEQMENCETNFRNPDRPNDKHQTTHLDWIDKGFVYEDKERRDDARRMVIQWSWRDLSVRVLLNTLTSKPASSTSRHCEREGVTEPRGRRSRTKPDSSKWNRWRD